MPTQSIAVFCGSKKGNDPLFMQHAALLGRIIGEHNITLVYGGGSTGLMGAVADAAMEQGTRVVGIIPQVLVDWEHQHEHITELIIVEDMHSRKKKLYELCDAAVILPGGFGTLDELFEMLTWNQLSIHTKPVYFINSNGFYTHLIAHLQQLQQQGFLYDPLEERMCVLREPSEILPYLL